jgi:hypothetical protein
MTREREHHNPRFGVSPRIRWEIAVGLGVLLGLVLVVLAWLWPVGPGRPIYLPEPSTMSAPIDPAADQAAAEEAAETYTDIVKADAWDNLYDLLPPNLRELVRRGDFLTIQTACAKPAPTYFDVRHVTITGDTAWAGLDLAGKDTRIDLVRVDGTWYWQPSPADQDRYRRAPAEAVGECKGDQPG